MSWEYVRTDAIRSGEFVEYVYDYVDMNEGKYRYQASCGKSTLLSHMAAPPPLHGITRYLYATSRSTLWGGTNWMGYIGYRDYHDEFGMDLRHVHVVIRGTLAGGEWWKNLQARLTPFPGHSGAKVHSGFLHLYSSSDAGAEFKESFKDMMLEELERLITVSSFDMEFFRLRQSDTKIVITGHSLGGALATLAACDVASKFPNTQVEVYVFGSPKVGDEGFKAVAEKAARIFRFENIGDIVPALPPSVPLFFPYVHVGTAYKLNWAALSEVKDKLGLRPKHDLELSLYTIAKQVDEFIPKYAYEEVGLSPSTSVDDLLKELTGQSEAADEELSQIREAFVTDEGTDEEGYRQYLLECVYILRAQTEDFSAPSGRAFKGEQSAQSGRAFKGEVIDRNYVLINKFQDSLRDTRVPPAWWVLANKDVKQEGSKWLPRFMRPGDQPIASNDEYN